jgi:hypothetical protein
MDIFTSMSEFPPRTFPAHDLIGDLWLNTDPLALHGLRGHVILLFFWDFACGTSLSLLPTVQEWYRRYGPYGLVALGVHSPKFPFSGDPARVRKEALRIGVSLPVVVDRSQLVWSRYDCRTWPTILLIDADGYLRSRHEGYQESQSVEQAVRYLLHDAGSSEGLPDPSPSFDRAGEGNAAGGGGPAGEVFAGYRRPRRSIRIPGSTCPGESILRDPGSASRMRSAQPGRPRPSSPMPGMRLTLWQGARAPSRWSLLSRRTVTALQRIDRVPRCACVPRAKAYWRSRSPASIASPSTRQPEAIGCG